MVEMSPLTRRDPSVFELMDRMDSDSNLVRDALRHLRRINKWFGAVRAVEQCFVALLDQCDPGTEVRVLDLATGSGDLPLALSRLAKRRRRQIRILAVDRHPIMVEAARALVRSAPEISVERADIIDFSLHDRTFDIVTCSSVLHHFSRPQAIRLLRTMCRLASRGLIVQDLVRGRIGVGAAWTYTHLVSRNPILLSDATQSVLRAFTPEELGSMATEAGIPRWTVRRFPLFRMVLTASLKPA